MGEIKLRLRSPRLVPKKTVVLCTRLNPEASEWLNRFAKQRNESRSSAASALLEAAIYLTKHTEEPPNE